MDPDDMVYGVADVVDGGGGDVAAASPTVELVVPALKRGPPPPFCEASGAPSQTRKRLKGKALQLVPFDVTVRPAADGTWQCTTCPAVYDSRARLFGHARFCEGQNVWRCEWCACREAETHHKANGPNGPNTLCSACSARYRSGHNGMPDQNDKGEWECDKCGRGFPSINSLGGHRRFCDGGIWRCAWCHCRGEDAGNKSVGPDGPGTLCGPCSARFRSGHTGPPTQNEEGKFVCQDCGRTFDNISGLGSHRARCDGGVWRCEWCECKYEDTGGKGPGPNGAKTLCSACSGRFRGGATGPPTKNEEGKYVCDLCERAFDSISAVGTHRRRCDGGKWRCGWCECKADECSGKGPGPLGAGTLCSNCSGRYRNGASGAVKRDESGNYICDCGRTFATNAGLGGHRRRCSLLGAAGGGASALPLVIGRLSPTSPSLDSPMAAAYPEAAGGGAVLEVVAEPTPDPE